MLPLAMHRLAKAKAGEILDEIEEGRVAQAEGGEVSLIHAWQISCASWARKRLALQYTTTAWEQRKLTTTVALPVLLLSRTKSSEKIA